MKRMGGRSRGAWCLALGLSWAALGVQTGVSAARADPPHRASDEHDEVVFLIRRGTPESLATASLLVHLTPDYGESPASAKSGMDPTLLIQRAVALAPDRPELVWLQLRDCQQRRCPQERALAAKLRVLDPENGLSWLADMRWVDGLGAPAMTDLIGRAGSSANPRLYWNRLVVVMFDALTHGPRDRPATALSFHADDRLMHVIGVLGAEDSPAFQTLALACRSDQFAQPGRREACAGLMRRLESSDSVLAQNFSLSTQEGWWAQGSAEFGVLRQRHQQQRYLTIASARQREDRADADAVARVDAMRRLSTEEEVERATLAAFDEPLQRPDDWQPPPGP